MRRMMRLTALAALLVAGLAAPPPLAQAANLDTTADRVLGQATFSTGDPNHGTLGASGLNQPIGVAVDRQGNLFVADAGNNRVLEYDAPLVTHEAASRVLGQPGFTTNDANHGGLGAASLFSPYGVALDASGDLYVADTGNNRVLEFAAPFSTDEAASRVFGQPNFTTNGHNQGGLGARSLYNPVGLVLDPQGNLYVGDYANNRVLEYNAPLATHASAYLVFGQPTFITNTVNHGGLNANSLDGPSFLTRDPQGDLYVADSLNNRVLEYDDPLLTDTSGDRVFGQTSFITRTANNGGRSAATLSNPLGLALDAQGDLYVADGSNNRVLQYNHPLSNQSADRVYGQPTFATGDPNHSGRSADSLSTPAGVAIDPSGNLYLGDFTNNRALEYDQPVAYDVPVLSAISPSDVAAGSPSFRLVADGAHFVAGSVVRWNGADLPTYYWSSTQITATVPAADVAAGGPFAVTVFTPSGGTSPLKNLSLYARVGHDTLADGEQGQPDFQAIAPNNGNLIADSHLYSPQGLVVSAATGRMFVADLTNDRVLSWPTAAALANGQPADLVIGQPNLLAAGANNGGRSAATLDSPGGVALDAFGDLYVSDYHNNRVLEYNAPLSSGMAASHVFGQGGSFTTGLPNNGGISPNSLKLPQTIALDALGNLYVADTSNNRVLEFDNPLADQSADRVIGQMDFTHNLSDTGGLGSQNLFDPISLALDAQGNLYVADFGNNRVLEYNAPLATGQAASRVFGQADFTHRLPNYDGINEHTLNLPAGVALSGQGHLFVADFFNNRVLEFDSPLASPSANRVFGQPSFNENTPNNGGPGPGSLDSPAAVATDAQNNLYVADLTNNRVLEYDWASAKLELPLLER